MSQTIKSIIAGMLLSKNTTYLQIEQHEVENIVLSVTGDYIIFYHTGGLVTSVEVYNSTLNIEGVFKNLDTLVLGINHFRQLKGDCKTYHTILTKCVGKVIQLGHLKFIEVAMSHKKALAYLTTNEYFQVYINNSNEVFITDRGYFFQMKNNKIKTYTIKKLIFYSPILY